MNIDLFNERSQSIKFIQTQTIYEQPFFTPNINLLSISDNLLQEKIQKQQSSRATSPRKIQEFPKKTQTSPPVYSQLTIIPSKSENKPIIEEKKIIKPEDFQRPTMEQKKLIGRAKVLFLEQRSLNMKKYFRIVTFAIIAANRFRKTINNSLWKRYQTQLKNVTFFLKLELVQTERINNWCKAILTKSLSSVNTQLHDFILHPQDKEKSDISIIKTINSCQFLFENLAFFTQQKCFCDELKYYLLSQLFLEHKNYFTKFVSDRTNYLHNKNRLIKKEELMMILTESILLDQILVNMFNSSQTCVFLLKILASVLQVFFNKKFQLIKKKRNQQKNISTFLLTQPAKKLQLKRIPLTEDNDYLIQGLYTAEQLNLFLTYKKQATKQLDLAFDKFCQQLHATVLL